MTYTLILLSHFFLFVYMFYLYSLKHKIKEKRHKISKGKKTKGLASWHQLKTNSRKRLKLDKPTSIAEIKTSIMESLLPRMEDHPNEANKRDSILQDLILPVHPLFLLLPLFLLIIPFLCRTIHYRPPQQGRLHRSFVGSGQGSSKTRQSASRWYRRKGQKKRRRT